MNKFIGIGCLGGNPEQLSNGCKFCIAIKSFNGKEETVTWIKILVFGIIATNCIKVLEKGRRIAVEGRLDKAHNGELVIIANDILFL